MMKMLNQKNDLSKIAAFSLIELLVVISLVSITTGYAALKVTEFYKDARTAKEQILSHYKLIRSRAISNTKAFRYSATSNQVISVSSRDTCDSSDPWIQEPSETLTLSGSAILSDPTWFVCINSRGFPDANISFSVEDDSGDTGDIEIYLGGGIEAT